MNEDKWEELDPNKCMGMLKYTASNGIFREGKITYRGRIYKFDGFRISEMEYKGKIISWKGRILRKKK